jgi:predicted transcriptional regulator
MEFDNDNHMVKIFESIVDSPKTAQQISEKCSIPRSTVYRKLRKLEENQIILRKGIIENGIRNRIYKPNKV